MIEHSIDSLKKRYSSTKVQVNRKSAERIKLEKALRLVYIRVPFSINHIHKDIHKDIQIYTCMQKMKKSLYTQGIIFTRASFDAKCFAIEYLLYDTRTK